MATPLTNWLRPWLPPATGETALEPANAATIYRKAFGWVEGLRPDDKAWLLHPETRALDDPHVAALIRKARPVLKAIRQAATIDRCHWETEILSRDDLGADRLSVFNIAIIRVACLSARRHAARGRGRAALDDLFAALTLAHRLGTGGVFIARLLEHCGEFSAFQTLGRILPELDLSARSTTFVRGGSTAACCAWDRGRLGRDRPRVAVHRGLSPRQAHGGRADARRSGLEEGWVR